MSNARSGRVSELRIFSTPGLLGMPALGGIIFITGLFFLILLNFTLYLVGNSYDNFQRKISLRQSEILQLKHSGVDAWVWKQSMKCNGVLSDLNKQTDCMPVHISFKKPENNNGYIFKDNTTSLCVLCHGKDVIKAPVYWTFSVAKPFYAYHTSTISYLVLNSLGVIFITIFTFICAKRAQKLRPSQLVYTAMRLKNFEELPANLKKFITETRKRTAYYEKSEFLIRMSMMPEMYDLWLKEFLGIFKFAAVSNHAEKNITVVSMSDSFTGVPVSAESLRMTTVISARAQGKIILQKSLFNTVLSAETLATMPNTRKAVWKTKKGNEIEFIIA